MPDRDATFFNQRLRERVWKANLVIGSSGYLVIALVDVFND
jgi:hypothetical protein